MKTETNYQEFESIDEEQLPVSKHKLHDWTHFAGLYAAEHVAATEFVIGATFVALGATTKDILLGLLIGNILAVLSWTLITAPIAVETRLSLYTYLNKIAGDSMTKLYNWANIIIFTVISAAMITVSATAVRFAFNIPAQLDWYPTNLWFVLIVLCVGLVVVAIAIYGFKAVTEFSGICAPWLFVMFLSGAFVLLPALSLSDLGQTIPSSWADFVTLGDHTIWTGLNSKGEPGIGLVEVIGFAWAANTITHFGLIDMAMLRFAKKKSYGLSTSTGMMFGHYVAWISAGIMGAGAAVIIGKPIVALDPGDVAYYALGWSGFVIVIVAGWTTAIANLYRAGLAAQAVFNSHSRKKSTLVVGVVTMIVACFPFVFSQILPLLTYAGLLVVPVGGIVFAEHQIFPKIGYTRYWSHYKKLTFSTPAIVSWGLGLVFGFGLNIINIMPFYYLFIPTWIFTIIVYTLLAGKYGAKESYPTEVLEEKVRNENIAKYQDQKAIQEVAKIQDNSIFSKVLGGIAIMALAITLYLSCKVLFGSADESIYIENRDIFYRYAFVCTVIYFVMAYWKLKRGKIKNI
ncbi:predicted mannitol permease [Formosa agariphila KMM 3901]|uniref:Predicted mannitol permease n=1 Tax=Formosa agariphila (strain DSM 15362 / KCTC 12365 / LMG 23005 / KMM 3901 / M-2Alg 35-1) TaxID=1347342 RepID=T2KIZ2_FORAG|nr:membrane protein [Formosa agariphila]CDF78765.1 predicted mannitol permease [Formosa agariphila KMM 3901]